MIYSKIQIENYKITHNLRKNNLLENSKWQDKNNQKEWFVEKFKQKKDDKVQMICLKIQVRKSLFLKKIFALCSLFLRKFAYAFLLAVMIWQKFITLNQGFLRVKPNNFFQILNKNAKVNNDLLKILSKKRR